MVSLILQRRNKIFNPLQVTECIKDCIVSFIWFLKSLAGNRLTEVHLAYFFDSSDIIWIKKELIELLQKNIQAS